MDYHIKNAKSVLKKNGKSFYWAGKLLTEEYINRASLLYCFCRALDDIADSGKENALNQLNSIRLNVRKKLFSKLENLYKIKYPTFFKEPSHKAVIDLIDGLILDQNNVLFKEQRELIRYSYHVAGTVGLMMCDAVKCTNDEAKLFAIDLGIAMQLTNIARDVLEDANMGRRYLPGSWIDNISPNDIVIAAKTNDLKKIKIISNGIKKLLLLAESYYSSGAKGFFYLPLKSRIAISVASGVYRQIGVQLQNQKHNWHNGRQVTSILTKTKITLLSILKELFLHRLKKEHKSELHIDLKGLVNFDK